MTWRSSMVAAVALGAAIGGPAHAQPLPIPANPIAAVEGEWFAEDADMAIQIHNGVVTAKAVKSKLNQIVAGGISDGTVVARWTGFNGPAKGNSFSGECWTNGERGWSLYKCAEAGNISTSTDGKGSFYRLYVLNRDWRRKADFQSYMWKYRK